MDETCPLSTEGWTRRVHFVREGGGGSCMSQMSSVPLLACHVKCENACPHRRVPSVWGQGTQRVRLVPGGRNVCPVSTRGCKGGGLPAGCCASRHSSPSCCCTLRTRPAAAWRRQGSGTPRLHGAGGRDPRPVCTGREEIRVRSVRRGGRDPRPGCTSMYFSTPHTGFPGRSISSSTYAARKSTCPAPPV